MRRDEEYYHQAVRMHWVINGKYELTESIKS